MITTEAATAFMALFGNNTDWANVGDAAGIQNSATAGSLYVGLYTATPDVGGSQTTNEVSYTGYARFALARSSAGWTCSGNLMSNAVAVQLGACTVGTPTATFLGIGTAPSGAGHLIGAVALDSPLDISPGLNPTFPIGALAVQIISPG